MLEERKSLVCSAHDNHELNGRMAETAMLSSRAHLIKNKTRKSETSKEHSHDDGERLRQYVCINQCPVSLFTFNLFLGLQSLYLSIIVMYIFILSLITVVSAVGCSLFVCTFLASIKSYIYMEVSHPAQAKHAILITG